MHAPDSQKAHAILEKAERRMKDNQYHGALLVAIFCFMAAAATLIGGSFVGMLGVSNAQVVERMGNPFISANVLPYDSRYGRVLTWVFIGYFAKIVGVTFLWFVLGNVVLLLRRIALNQAKMLKGTQAGSAGSAGAPSPRAGP